MSPCRVRGLVTDRRPRWGPCDDEEHLPDEWWELFDEGFRAYSSDGWRAGPEAERQL